jgi:hypothetical protein
VQIDGSATDGFYLKLGTSVRLRDNERTALGALVILCDREGRCSLHEVIGIHRPDGKRTLRVGPQVDWPQGGGKELRYVELPA